MPGNLIAAQNVQFGPGGMFTIPRFEVKVGEKVLLMGPSGSGKTTFLEFLAGFREGHAEVLARPASLAMVFQDLNLIDDFSIRENLSLELESRDLDQALRWLKELELPASPQTRVKNLSKGEQQRLAVIRALAKRSELLLADEPTSHLDRSRAEKLIELLTKNSTTALVVGHDPHLERFFDRVILFEKLTA